MKATYNEKTGKFTLIWFDALKAYKGEKSPYGRKQKSWKGDKKPTKKEQSVVIAELLEYGKQQEELARHEAQVIQKESLVSVDGELQPDSSNINEPVNAVKWLSEIKARDISKAEHPHTIQTVTRIIARFRDWLKKNYPFIALHDIRYPIISEYINLINTSSTAENNYKYLKLVWRKIGIDFEDSKLPYKDPFRNYKFEKTLPTNEKLAFTTQQMQLLLYYATNKAIDDECEEYRIKYRKQKVFVLYMLMVTGWRIGDILNLTWEQINFSNRTITLKHKKTAKKTAHETILYVTPLMGRVLKAQAELGKTFPYNSHLVFNLRSIHREVNPISYHSEIGKIIKSYCLNNGIYKETPQNSGFNLKNYTIHCIRKSVITELQLVEQFSSERIHYLVGHRDNSTQGKHYIKFKMYPERTTRALVEHMEGTINAEYCINLILKGEVETIADEFKQNRKLGYTEIHQLKSKFWEDDAIGRLEELHRQGTNRVRINGLIKECDGMRHEFNLPAVTVKMVDAWYNLSYGDTKLGDRLFMEIVGEHQIITQTDSEVASDGATS